MSKYVRKSVLIFTIFMAIGIVGIQPAYAYLSLDNLTIEDYIVTVKKVEIAKDDYQSGPWIVLGQGNQNFDLADCGVDQTVGTYISNPSLDAGTYNYIRITIDRSIIIKGYGDKDSTTYYTTSSINPTFGNLAETETPISSPPVSGDYAPGSFSIPLDAADPDISTQGGILEFVNNNNDVRLVQDLSQTSNPITISADGTANIKAFFAVNDSEQSTAVWQSDPSLRFEKYDGDYGFYISTPTVVVFTRD